MIKQVVEVCISKYVFVALIRKYLGEVGLKINGAIRTDDNGDIWVELEDE